jgi:chloride channel protein, CIC family
LPWFWRARRLIFGAPMSRRQNVPAGDADGSGNLFALALLALIVGAAAGFVGAVFRLALEQADRLRDTV